MGRTDRSYSLAHQRVSQESQHMRITCPLVGQPSSANEARIRDRLLFLLVPYWYAIR